LFSKHNDAGINGEPDDSSGRAIPADAVNGLDEITKCQSLFFMIGFHAMTISRETVRALWGFHPWALTPSGISLIQSRHSMRADSRLWNDRGSANKLEVCLRADSEVFDLFLLSPLAESERFFAKEVGHSGMRWAYTP
jgi:hypothetical protein